MSLHVRLGAAATAGVAAGLFAILTDGRPDAWWVGVPAVALAVAARGPGARPALRPLAVLRLAPGLAVEALRGAVDVARRVLSPRLAIDPILLRHRWALGPGRPRAALVVLLNLTPGTLTVSAGDRVLRVHALDGPGAAGAPARWEARTARLFREVQP